MANRIQVRRDTAANWTSANPVLAAGEPALETDTGRRKTGDGTTVWTALPYVFDKTIADGIYTTPAAADAAYAPITGSANYLAPGQLDAANAANITTPASATATALNNTYASKSSLAPSAVTDAPTVAFSASQPISAGVVLTLNAASPVTYTDGPASVDSTTNAEKSNLRNGQLGLRFNLYGASVAVKVYPLSTSPSVRVTVGGNLVTPRAGTFLPGAVIGTPQYVLLAFPDSRYRTIEITGKDANWLAVATEATGYVSPAPKTSGLRLIVLGDSWTGGANGIAAMNTFASQLGGKLGIDGYTAGIGGTGYVNAGPGAGSYTFPYADATNRLAAIAAAAPTDVLIAGSINDKGSSYATINSAAASVYTYFATNSPTTRLHVMLPQPGMPSDQAADDMVLNRLAVLIAAQQATNVYTIVDPVTAAWFTGTGNAGTPAGDGNRDRFLSNDAVHPTQDGHDYVADLLTAALTPVVGAVKSGRSVTPLPVVTTYAVDNFNRADGAIGTTIDGKTWQPVGGTWNVASKAAAAPTITTPAYGTMAVIDTGQTDAKVKATILGGTWGQGLAFRIGTDNSGYILYANTTVFRLYSKDSTGALTTLHDFTYGIGSGNVLEAGMIGSALTIKVNGVVIGTLTDTTHPTGTKQGIFSQNTSRTMDDFQITSP